MHQRARLLPARPCSFVTLALHTGMRRGELQALRWEGVDLNSNILRMEQDKAGGSAFPDHMRVALERLAPIEYKMVAAGGLEPPTRGL